MKIDNVLFSCDSSPMYRDFWNPISKHWKIKFGIHPVLLYVGDDLSDLDDSYGTIIQKSTIPQVPDYMSATWGRFWATSLFPNQTCLIGDIDMIPLSVDFFTKQILPYDDDSYIHINGDGYSRGNHHKWKEENLYSALGAYGHIAKGIVFNTVYSFEQSFEEEMFKYFNTKFNEVIDGKVVSVKYSEGLDPHLSHANNSSGGKWGHDEMYSTYKLLQYYKNGGKVETNMSIPPHKRIDRIQWNYDSLLVKNGWYIDSHLLRPYSQYKDHIDYLMSLVEGF